MGTSKGLNTFYWHCTYHNQTKQYIVEWLSSITDTELQDLICFTEMKRLKVATLNQQYGTCQIYIVDIEPFVMIATYPVFLSEIMIGNVVWKCVLSPQDIMQAARLPVELVWEILRRDQWWSSIN